MSNLRVHLLALVAAVVVLPGCGQDEYLLLDVVGRVTTCDGKPATGGTIIFSPIDDPDLTGRPKGMPGREARGVVAEDGTFHLVTTGKTHEPGVVNGRHSVSFEMPPTKRPVLTPGDKQALGPEGTAQREQEIAAMPVYPPLPCSNLLEPNEVTISSVDDKPEFQLKKK
jgi:hypothetical protein